MWYRHQELIDVRGGDLYFTLLTALQIVLTYWFGSDAKCDPQYAVGIPFLILW